jgi:UDP-N-acetylglucosamine--N-acetylmuramyl-(pentapeptide) pyrophosphoryl-undecaprenol N-acetylglucosamine transferase
VVLATGGSQGAEALNRILLEAIEGVVSGDLPRPEDLQILWATGPKNFVEVDSSLQAMGRPSWVRATGYIEDMPEALVAATLAVGRAGAMTTSEFLASSLPALLVPLPTAAADHQTRNAESLAQAGVALHLPEAGLSGTGLWSALTTLLTESDTLEAMVSAAGHRGRPEATREIAEALALLLPESAHLERGMVS